MKRSAPSTFQTTGPWTAAPAGSAAFSPAPDRTGPRHLVLAAWGVFLGLGLIKFGNPVIMESLISTPSDLFEWVLSPWPIGLGYAGLAVLLALTLLGDRPDRVLTPRWLMALPAAWLLWQCLSAAATVDAALTRLTIPHFIACVACFYAGAFWLGRRPSLRGAWAGVVVALFWVVVYGADQRFRGLAEARDFILQHEATHWREFPEAERARWEQAGTLIRTPEGWTAHPKLLEKAQSRRISSTLFYPNTLAGALLFFTPPAVWFVATTARMTPAARALAGLLLGGGALACLYWSGSKAGWLIGIGLALLAFLAWPVSAKLKGAIAAVLILGGLTVFTIRYGDFFRRGAPSVVARWDYWQAAWQTAWAHPWLGTGPGTFQRPYAQLKRPESEMARLTHNDYLQQASDSGWPAAILYLAWVGGVLACVGRRVWRAPSSEGFFVWLGWLGWAVQSLVEFNLYIPALAWPAFLLAGWLLAQADPNRLTRVHTQLSLNR